ncbi:MAG: glycosyltransferase family 2 protein, partial [Pseudomonadota bacterium]
MKFDLTVIIPTFQMPEHTVAALESVIAQAGAGLAITVIVVDDASSEPFVSTVAPTTHCEVRVIRHKRNRGAAAARVTGIKASTTQWIAFLDADDTFLPHTLLPRLEFAVAEQRKRPDTPLFVCGGWVEREEDSLRVRIPNPAQSLAALCSGCWYCPGSTLIVQRRWLTGQPGYPDAGLRRLEDFDWGIRLGRAGGEVAVWDGAAARIQ